MKEEERAIMKAKVEVPIVSEQVETFNAKLLEKEVVLKQAEMEVKLVDCPKPSNCVQLAQPQGGLVSGTTPAPLPACQPTIFHSKPLTVEAVGHADCVIIGGAHKEEIGFQTASQGELIAIIPKEAEPVVNKEIEELIVIQEVEGPVLNNPGNSTDQTLTRKTLTKKTLTKGTLTKAVLNKEVAMIGATQVEQEAFKHVEATMVAEEEAIVMEDEEEVTNKLVEEEESLEHVEEEGFINHVEEFSISVEGFDYDENTGQISYQNQPVEFATPQLREQVLAKMFQVINEGSNPPSKPASPKGLEPSPISPEPLNLRHQERRLTFGHLSQAKVQSLGRWTSWTKSLLMSDLEAAFSKPRRGIIWSNFSPEEKLAHFDMVNWEATFPLDPPPRSLMFEADEDQWSTWA